jgi:hypothetical protein
MDQTREDELLETIQMMGKALELLAMGFPSRDTDECFRRAQDLTAGTPFEFKLRH